MGRAKKILSRWNLFRAGAVSTFVTVGNSKQRFDRLMDIIEYCSDLLPKPIYIQTGYNEYDICQHNDVECTRSFSGDNYKEILNTSEILVMHAGAGSLINAVRLGKKPVIMPRNQEYGEHVDNHQVEFAHQIKKTNLAFVINNQQELENILKNDTSFVQGEVSKSNSGIRKMLSEDLDNYLRQTS